MILVTFRSNIKRGEWVSVAAALAISITAARAQNPAEPYTHSISAQDQAAPPLALLPRRDAAPVKPAVRAASETPAKPPSSDSFFRPPSAKPWSAMLYGGFGTGSNLDEALLFDIRFVDSQFIGGVVNREMFTFYRRHFSFELEGQALRHVGRQDNGEFNGLYLIRLNTFPWDRYVNTSFAVGSGLSYATSTPVIEAEKHPGETSRLMHYLIFELAFGLPDIPDWSLATRLHHRSGVFGLFNGADGGSNFLAAGLRYHF